MSKTPRWDALCAAAVDDPVTFPKGIDSPEFKLRWAELTRSLERENAELADLLEGFADWPKPSKRDWENGAVRDGFDLMQRAARDALAKRGKGAT